jgi:hypothetical protein
MCWWGVEWVGLSLHVALAKDGKYSPSERVSVNDAQHNYAQWRAGYNTAVIPWQLRLILWVAIGEGVKT